MTNDDTKMEPGLVMATGALPDDCDAMAGDFLLPAQRLQTLQPEARLALAVLEDAVATLRATHGVQVPRARLLGMEAWRWVCDDASGPFAFRWICQHLGLDVDWLRVGLARWRPWLASSPRTELTAARRGAA